MRRIWRVMWLNCNNKLSSNNKLCLILGRGVRVRPWRFKFTVRMMKLLNKTQLNCHHQIQWRMKQNNILVHIKILTWRRKIMIIITTRWILMITLILIRWVSILPTRGIIRRERHFRGIIILTIETIIITMGIARITIIGIKTIII